MGKYITVIGANENNLKNISVKIPTHKITCINGISGSGKSSFIHGVLAAEFKRRKKIVNGKASKCDLLVRPDFEKASWSGDMHAVSQKSLRRVEVSTVATVSGINDTIRKHFLDNGLITCSCGEAVDNEISYETIHWVAGQEISDRGNTVYYKLLERNTVNIKKVVDVAQRLGFTEFKIGGIKKTQGLNYIGKLNEREKYTIYAVVKNIGNLTSNNSDPKNILIESKNKTIFDFSFQIYCKSCREEYQKKSLSLFTRSKLNENNGCCKECNGKGVSEKINFSRLIDNKSILSKPFLNIPHNGSAYKYVYLQDSHIFRLLKKHNTSNDIKFSKLKPVVKAELIRLIESKVVPHKGHHLISEFFDNSSCEYCRGTGFNYKSRAVHINNKNIDDILSLPIKDAISHIDTSRSSRIAKALIDLSLSHLPLNRSTNTLSGGELQRLKLSKYISLNMSDSTLIIDEPSLGLSLTDCKGLMSVLVSIKNMNNTVILIDHSKYVINSSDYNLKFGPGAGPDGGNIIIGSRKEKEVNKFTRKTRLVKNNKFLQISKISNNNIKDASIGIPLHCLTSVIGVSGSGKSSLITAAIEKLRSNNKSNVIISMNQDEISVNVRSTIATFLGVFDEIRGIYANTDLSKKLNLDQKYFSSNNVEGCCKNCNGIGYVDDDKCPSCCGDKFNSTVLGVMFGGLNISELLKLSFIELIGLELSSEIVRLCQVMIDLGVGYLSLGRTTPSLSGGECQRIKFAKHICKDSSDLLNPEIHCSVFLDEPTRGLSYFDSNKVLSILDYLIDVNNTIIVIEHNDHIIKSSDYIIEVGPGAGADGGKIIYSGNYSEYEKSLKNSKINSSPIAISKIRKLDCETWTDDDYFKKITDYYQNHCVIDVDNLVIFNSKESLISKIGHEIGVGFYFNPFIEDIYLYGRLTKSRRIEIILDMISLGFNAVIYEERELKSSAFIKNNETVDPWKINFHTYDIGLAYHLGCGCVITKIKSKKSYNSTRLIDSRRSVVGTNLITKNTFNKYYSECNLCTGVGEIHHSERFILDPTKSIIDIDFYQKDVQPYVKKHLFYSIRQSVKKFFDEGVFDFTVSYSKLSKAEKERALYGCPGLSFMKRGGRSNAISDKIVWRGLVHYIENLSVKFDSELKVKYSGGKRRKKCPQCKGTGYRRELNYYHLAGKPIYE